MGLVGRNKQHAVAVYDIDEAPLCFLLRKSGCCLQDLPACLPTNLWNINHRHRVELEWSQLPCEQLGMNDCFFVSFFFFFFGRCAGVQACKRKVGKNKRHQRMLSEKCDISRKGEDIIDKSLQRPSANKESLYSLITFNCIVIYLYIISAQVRTTTPENLEIGKFVLLGLHGEAGSLKIGERGKKKREQKQRNPRFSRKGRREGQRHKGERAHGADVASATWGPRKKRDSAKCLPVRPASQNPASREEIGRSIDAFQQA